MKHIKINVFTFFLDFLAFLADFDDLLCLLDCLSRPWPLDVDTIRGIRCKADIQMTDWQSCTCSTRAPIEQNTRARRSDNRYSNVKHALAIFSLLFSRHKTATSVYTEKECRSAIPNSPCVPLQRWAPGEGVQGVQNVPRSACVSQQTSRLPFRWQRRFLPTRCEVPEYRSASPFSRA